MGSVGSFLDDRKKLWRGRDRVRVCAWFEDTLNPDSFKYQCYRIYGLNVDRDIERAAWYLRKKRTPLVKEEAEYALRQMWRFLLRNYAVRESCRIGRILNEWGEPWPWRVWRWKDRFFPRLFVGVVAGFLLLSASSELTSILESIAEPESGRDAWFWGLIAAGPIIVLLLAIAEVQRRVGRRPWPVIVGRAAIITALGIVYAAVGAGVIYVGSEPLGKVVCGRFAEVCASMALLLGFVFQLFWQERSIADPL
jgi:hypothetical protein